MSRKTLTFRVNPAVLKWARESAAASIADVAKRVHTSGETVKQWEEGTRSPTLRTLEELAVFYKRPLAVFYLPSPPPEAPLPTDFRILRERESLPLSRKTRLAIREARRLQVLATTLMKEMGLEVQAKLVPSQ